MSRRAALGAKSSLVVAHGGETVYTARIEVLVKSQVVAFAYTWTRFSLVPASESSRARCATARRAGLGIAAVSRVWHGKAGVEPKISELSA